ncbi:MAG TPA: hypothetical protein VN372_12205 [Methanospirillum sp.]|nr:hypothetical protein [Methanospirillum sp.]
MSAAITSGIMKENATRPNKPDGHSQMKSGKIQMKNTQSCKPVHID